MGPYIVRRSGEEKGRRRISIRYYTTPNQSFSPYTEDSFRKNQSLNHLRMTHGLGHLYPVQTKRLVTSLKLSHEPRINYGYFVNGLRT